MYCAQDFELPGWSRGIIVRECSFKSEMWRELGPRFYHDCLLSLSLIDSVSFKFVACCCIMSWLWTKNKIINIQIDAILFVIVWQCGLSDVWLVFGCPFKRWEKGEKRGEDGISVAVVFKWKSNLNKSQRLEFSIVLKKAENNQESRLVKVWKKSDKR